MKKSMNLIKKIKTLAFLFLTLTFSLFLIDLLLHFFLLFSPQTSSIIFQKNPLIVDEQIGNIGNPNHPDHDRRGWRNKFALSQANIVTLGDSHTYGTSVKVEESWPYLLRSKTGLQVYNMALPGHSVGHSLLHLAEAKKLNPELIVLSIYFGNDFWEIMQLSTFNHEISSFVSSDDKKKFIELEKVDPMGEKWERLFGATISSYGSYKLRVFMSKYSSIYGLLRAIKNQFDNRSNNLLDNDMKISDLQMTDEQSNLTKTFEGEWTTILTPSLRNFVNDRTDARIETGFYTTLDVLLSFRKKLQNDAELLIVLLPTKEAVFYSKVPESITNENLNTLFNNETLNREDLKDFLELNDFNFLDMTDNLSNSPVQTYFRSADGHPNKYGHEVIAISVEEWIQKENLTFSN